MHNKLIELEETKKSIKFSLKTEIGAKSYDHFSETKHEMKHILKVEYETTSFNIKNSRIWQKLLTRGFIKEPSTSLSGSACPCISLSYRVKSIQVKIVNL